MTKQKTLNRLEAKRLAAKRLAASAALCVIGSAMPAYAGQYVVTGPKVEAYANAMAIQGPYYAGSSVDVVNGVAETSVAANGGSASTSPLTPGFGPVSVQVGQDGGSGDRAFSERVSASTDATTGIMRASVAATGGEFFGGPLGFTKSVIADTVFFNNTSGQAQMLNLVFTFDGLISLPANVTNQGGTAAMQLNGCSSCANDLGQYISFASNPSQAANNWVRAYFNEGGVYNVNDYGTPLPEGQSQNFYWSRQTDDGVGGVVNGLIATTLIIPTGITSLGIMLDLQLDCRGGSSCDFGNTSQFQFGPLADGLRFTSASGSFLTNAAQPPVNGAVPEPATWLMMIGGFALAGGALRRIRRERSGLIAA